MGALAFACMVAVLAVQPMLHVSTLPAPIVTTTVQGDQTTWRELRGWADCALTTHRDGRETWQVVKVTAIPSSLEHELLHAVDCTDNGRMDGSLLPFAPTWADAAHEWVHWAQAHPEQAIGIVEGLR